MSHETLMGWVYSSYTAIASIKRLPTSKKYVGASDAVSCRTVPWAIYQWISGHTWNNITTANSRQSMPLLIYQFAHFPYYRCNNYVDSKVWLCVNAWAWHQRHSHLNCLITEGSTWDWDNCLLFMLLLCAVIEWETCCCGSTIIENSKQKTTKHR